MVVGGLQRHPARTGGKVQGVLPDVENEQKDQSWKPRGFKAPAEQQEQVASEALGTS